MFNFIEKIQNKIIARDFEKRKKEIAKQRYEGIISKLQGYVIADSLYKDGLLLTEREARKRAVDKFIKAKKQGLIDSMNYIVKGF